MEALSVWSITGVGVLLVFGILLVLSEALRWIGKAVGPKPLAEVPTQAPAPAARDDSGRALRDAAIIAAIMADKGHEGRITVKRTTSKGEE